MANQVITLEEYLRLAQSFAEFSDNEDGTWTAEISVLPGCVTWGESRAEAVQMLEDAARGWIMTALRFGDPIPPIGNLKEYDPSSWNYGG